MVCERLTNKDVKSLLHEHDFSAQVLRYGIELDAYRAEQARKRIPNTIQGNALEAHCPVESLGCAYCNPPYESTLGSTESRRTEAVAPNYVPSWRNAAGRSQGRHRRGRRVESRQRLLAVPARQSIDGLEKEWLQKAGLSR